MIAVTVFAVTSIVIRSTPILLPKYNVKSFDDIMLIVFLYRARRVSKAIRFGVHLALKNRIAHQYGKTFPSLAAILTDRMETITQTNAIM